jgi:hypothetical protein
MSHSFATAADRIAALRGHLAAADRADAPFQICLGGPVTSRADVTRWEELGVTRLLVAPWARSTDAVAGLERFADLVGLEPRTP